MGINDAFKKSTVPNKQLLGIGAYRDDNNKPYILDCVKQAEEKILKDNMDHEYSGIDGNLSICVPTNPSFKDKCMKLAYG